MIEKIDQLIQQYEPAMLNGRRKASVLIPLIKENNQWHILYQVRSKDVLHAGDSSFPGGRVEKDESFRDAAIRETMEELNLSKDSIKVFGEMDYIINQRVEVHSFVGQLVDLEVKDIEPNNEVAELYTIPINYLLHNKPSYFSVNFNPYFDEKFLKEQKNKGKKYELLPAKEKVPYYDINEHLLYGLTADLTQRFIRIIRDEIL